MFRTAAFIIVMAATTISGFASPIDPSDAKVVVGPIAPASVEAGPVAAVVSESAVSTPQLSEGEQALVDWARGRFEEAGLSLPEIEVRFDPTRELCHNNDGLYRGDADGPHVVTICTRDSDTFAAQLERRRTLLHEFGHVWDTVNLTDEDREHIGHTLGTTGWYDTDLAWEERGVERFAETFVFNLLDQPARQLKVSVECGDLLRAFADATGAAPLGPGSPSCA